MSLPRLVERQLCFLAPIPASRGCLRTSLFQCLKISTAPSWERNSWDLFELVPFSLVILFIIALVLLKCLGICTISWEHKIHHTLPSKLCCSQYQGLFHVCLMSSISKSEHFFSYWGLRMCVLTSSLDFRGIHGYRFLIVCLVILWPLMPEAFSNTSR